MNLEDHVVSLELAKKLKELGMKQESLFYWSEGVLGEEVIMSDLPNGWKDEKEWEENKHYAAFTLVEICDFFPGIALMKNRNGCSASYSNPRSHNEIPGNTLIEASAKLLILLILEKEIFPIT